MRLNFCFPATGCQKLTEVDDACKLLTFPEKRVATEVAAGALGEEWEVLRRELLMGTTNEVSP